MTVLQVLMYVVLQLAITKTIDSFEYNFPVNSTKICPMNANEWSAASVRMDCNDTHGYHCVPDKNFSSLIEFCYPRGRRIPFQKGNCLELAYTGILNHVKCGNFTYGCPDKDYFSNEIYQYPACLRLADNCFAADLSCLKIRYSTQMPIEKTEANSSCLMEQSTREENIYPALIIAVIVISVSLLAMILVVLILCLKIHKQKQPAQEHNPSQMPLIEPAELVTKESGSKTYQETNTSECSQFIKVTSEDREIDQCGTADNDKGIFVDFTVEDSELFILLKRQCKNGVYIGFHYLNETRVKKREKREIFLQRDETGCTLLHYAGQGGCIAIVEEIMKTNIEVKLDIRCFQGQTVLDNAIKYQQKDMGEYLITKHKELLQDDSSQSSRDDSICTRQGIKPFHWVAWHGDLRMFHVLKQAGVDVTTETRNGLNVLDIAILRNKFEFCKHMIEYENMKYRTKRDECEWNVAHFAAYSNNVKVLELLKSKNVNLITAKTKTKKTTLHIACEQGHYEAVAFVTEYYEDLLRCMDDLKWNALHYASKGGNLKIFDLLQKKGLPITSLTGEEKTVLHIACTHKQVEMCEHIVKIFYNCHRELIDKSTTNNSWMAAHYIGVEKKGDGSEEKIIDILFEYGAELSEGTGQGWSIFQIAIDHLNVGLVKHLLSNTKYRNKLNISKESLLDHMKNTKDESISKILRDTV